MAELKTLTFLPLTCGPPRPKARNAYLALSAIYRGRSKRASSSQFHRSDFTSQPFTGSYDPHEKTTGPLAGASSFGAPKITPRVLKQHLDNFVVGQERAKKILSVAVYNHYQRIQELQRREDEEYEQIHQQIRAEMGQSHPIEDEFPGHQETIRLRPPSTGIGPPPIVDTTPLTIEKANILLLGPSGVGKTLMAKTLARVLSVPFSISDCTPFTQAGYIGEDVEVCVSRLLAAANYDVAAAERGIICLDEIDKISTAKVSHGRDVGGEGVQQALLKVIEGSTVQVQAKQEKSAKGPSSSQSNYTNSPLAGGIIPPTSSTSSGQNSSSGPSKAETYNVRTDNILFICAGAFIGLEKQIMNRIAKGSMGFGATIRSSSSSSALLPSTNTSSNSQPPIPNAEERALYAKHLPFFSPMPPKPPNHEDYDEAEEDHPTYNPLDLTTPTDLKSYGLIPELIGRIPTTAALSPLSIPLLQRVLLEPRNSLIKQYEQLFALSGVELRFTTTALREVATQALEMGTGARGLRTVVERVLVEAMFEVPGSSVKFCLVTGAVVRRECGVVYLARGQAQKFHAMIAAEEEEAERERRRKRGGGDAGQAAGGGSMGSFQEYREKSTAVGAG